MTELLTLDIDSIAAGGDGVGRHDGLAVFVPRTAPGDRVVARVERQKRFARGRVERVERPAAVRVEPKCPHYMGDDCGGCQLQHIGIEAQRAAKRTIVSDALRRIGHRTVLAPTMHAAPSAWRYRHRISVTMRRRGDTWVGGFHAAADPGRVFELDDCWIADVRVMELWRAVRAAADTLPVAGEVRVSVRAGESGNSVLVEGGDAWPASDAFLAAMPTATGVWWAPDGGRRRRVDAGTVMPAGASFAQVNPPVADALLRLVREHVAARNPRTVLDAYAGNGDLAAALHGLGIAVTAVEMDEEASAESARRLAAPSRAITARVEDVVASLLPADVVVINPPRTGVDATVARAIESAVGTTRAVVYVSCDPATLGRDLMRTPSWRVAALDAFDMFPQTAHVETVALLVPGATT